MNVRTRGSLLSAGIIALALLAGCDNKSSDNSNAVATPTFSPAGGTQTAPVDVTISTTTTGAAIRYTTDGSTPSATVGTVYLTPVHIDATTTLKAIAYRPGMDDSAVKTATYTFSTPSTFACLHVTGTSATANGETALSLQFPMESTDFTTENYTASFDVYFPAGATLPAQIQTQYPQLPSYDPMYFNVYPTLATGEWFPLSFVLTKANRAWPAATDTAPLNSASTMFRIVMQTTDPDTAVEYCVKNIKVTNGTATPLNIQIASDTDPASLGIYHATGTSTEAIGNY